MQKTTSARQPTSVLLPEDLHADLKKAADSYGMPLSTYIRHVLNQHGRVLGKTTSRRARTTVAA